MSTREIDIKEFARRVERVCDFLLAKFEEGGRDGSSDLKVIEDLKADAADIQFDKALVGSETLFGLDAYMKGDNVP